MDNEKANPSGCPSRFIPIIVTNRDCDSDPLSPGRETLKKWLGRKIRVVLRNKLVLIGIFSCTDHDENLVLYDCGTFVSGNEQPISVGKVMVPGHQISTVAIEMRSDEKEPQEPLMENKGPKTA
ncbi:N-alpha-acetyltransferase 38-A, NatC auxiliary subunit-like [Drosophila gunungcola]|uniref:Sm domain-containing protein n=1 Tax=Drosophila gunungcola TaxID=103775 RepID=A0A9Q0BMT3_9MUSC|nr:N-alpha-acetyltransferase 38-A, NatC auxiliary subunit-like [Drosophila gunungcola]KAI8038002.1 hypothetical protein M5D96_009043 [Drosophila gunungcola]